MKKTKDQLITIRMPASLTRELKKYSEKNHCLDLSEYIRSIVRKKCLEFADPYSTQMQKFRQEIQKDLIQKAKTKDQLINDLKRITEELAND